MFALRKKNFFDGKPKMRQKFEFENLKIPPNGPISGLGIFKFKFCFHFWADNINREEDIL